ncbi:hypothetical protein MACK_002559 [Theileria orientalis]|uniref:Uncharacterized protein n=1 Tax=Theileria orientalis TaxID=68886 RepID=A0A976MDR4_THEOR|nr:hypothetical protein MACK_002559 [Theileria orientalis]
MPSIYLRNKSGQYEAGGGVTASVSCENNTPCKLFQRYTHTLTPPQNGKIHVHKAIAGWALGVSKCLTLTTDGRYSSAKLKQVDVYFNKHDTSNTPLLFVLHFQKNGDGNGVENRYYRMSSYDKDATGCATKKIEGLCQYKNESDILCPLVQESDVLSDVLMYDIMQRPNGNGDGTPCTYNCNKINVTEEKNGQPTLTGTGFTRFKHTPNNGQTNGKKACVTYRCNTLLDSGSQELDDVQGKPYSCITVYFGEKAKRPCTHKGATPGVCVCPPGAKAATCTPGEGNTCPPATASPEQTCSAAPGDGTTDHQDVPLLLALHKHTSSNGDGSTNGEPDYYVHRRQKNAEKNGDQYYWVKLNGDNGNGLKQLLADIEMPEQREGLGNGALQAVLGQKPNGSNGTTYLTILLRRLEFDLTDSLVILMDKKKNGSGGPNGDYGDDQIQEAIATLQPKAQTGNINPLKLNGQKIQVTDANNGTNTCLTKHKYRVVAHDFGKATQSKLGPGCSAGLRFLVPTKENAATKYAELKLYQGDTTTPANLEYLYYQNGVTNGGHTQTEPKVYVVFYAGTGTGGDRAGTDHDPRPLLLCYQGQTYKPKDKTGYDQTWVKVDGLNKCLCQNGSDTANGKNETLLKAVTGVVGFLNQVQLQIHPGPSASAGAVQPCQAGTAGTSGATQCQPGPAGSSCTYEVHQFQGKPIKVQVKCEPVNAKSGSKTCYRKLTHQPIGTGTNGATSAPNANTGFRLGDVEYCPNGGGGSGRTGRIKYYGNGTASGQNGEQTATNKWAPLKSVTAYFYNDDTKYKDPLLVVLEFANGVPNNDKECYKLTKTANGSKLEWEKDTDAKNLVSAEGPDLARHLDAIRYCLKLVVKVELQHNGTDGKTDYTLVGRDAKPGSAGTFDKQINGGQVTVCEVVPCHKLNDSGYKCFKHDLKTALRGNHDKVAGLAFTLPGESGSVIEIPLYSGEDGQCAGDATSQKLVGQEVKCANGPGLANGQSGSKITYNQCMGDVCVYFYDGTKSGVQPAETDTVPLMVKFNGHFYKPCDRDNYFTRWVCVSELASVSCKPGCKCCCCPTNADCGSDCTAQCSTDACKDDCECCSQLVKALNEVNLALNRIDLDKSNLVKTGSEVRQDGAEATNSTPRSATSGSALPRKNPVATDAKSAYTRVVHRTKNGFQIGDIKYNNQDIVDSGVKINGGQNGGDTTIPIAGGTGHKTLVKSCQWNTVAAYYSKTDSKHQLPQLIVILKTDSEVQSGNGNTVTGSTKPSTAYGYYVLATKSGVGDGSGYEYKWVEVKEKPATGVELNDETDFKLLNSGVILLEQRDKGTGGSGSYGEDEISKAIESAIKEKQELASPGNSGKVNRLKYKTITITDETDDPNAGGHKCIKDYWFSAMGHNLDNLVNLGPPFKDKLPKVTLITGLRFLIPDSGEPGSYKFVKLCPNGTDDRCSEERHYYLSDKKIRVFFYGNDPRPLLLCCNGIAYKPKKLSVPMDVMQVIMDYDKWLKVPSIENCGCGAGTATPNTELLETLVEVVGFMNPVQLNPKQIPNAACKQMTKDSQPTAGSAATATYKLHDFTHAKKIMMKIKRETVNCYGKYTYEPGGTDGQNGEGFRLGDVVYTDNKHTGDPQKLDYHKNGTETNKWKPLVKAIVYYYNDDRDYCDPLLVLLEFKKGRDSSNNDKEYYKLTSRERDKVEWQQEIKEAQDLSIQEKLIEYLHRLRYYFKKVLRVEVWHSGTGAKLYPLMLSKRPGDSLTGFEQFESKTIEVTTDESCQALKETGYKCFKHKLTSIGAEYLHQIGAVNFYTRGTEAGKDVELKLNNQYMTPIMYNRCMGDIYVYFYGDDPRPLLVCYNGWAYRAKTMDDYDNQKWTKDDEAAECKCTQPASGTCEKCKLLAELVKVSDFLNPVKLNIAPRKTKPYTIHRFNGLLIWVKNEVKFATDKFCYNRYTHTHAGIYGEGTGFRLGQIQYSGKCIKETQNSSNGVGMNTGANKCISASDVDQKTRKPSPEVVVYYYKKDSNHEHPLLVALRKPEQDTTQGQVATSDQKYSPYFELQKKVGPGHQKEYTKKNNGGIDLRDTSPEGELARTLDSILFAISVKLRVVLAERPVPTKYSATKGYPKELDELKGFREDKEQRLTQMAAKARGTTTGIRTDPQAIYSSLTHHVLRTTEYKAQLFEANGKPVSPPGSPSANHIDVKVQEVNCHKSYSEAGYRCFCHRLTSTQNIEDVGGLKLAVFDGPSKQEIALCENSTGDKGSNNGKIDQITYTTCKGDLYVFFYGDDPRPLMLCYDGGAYRPMTMAGYCTHWVKVDGATTGSGQLDIPFRADPKVLEALYQVSVFMNPVRLCLTEEAIEAMEHKKNQSSQQAGSQKPGEHLYVAHAYPPQCIRVKVTGNDLRCYKQYVHRPAIDGYRLGQVTYAGAVDAGTSVKPAQNGTCTASQTPGPAGPAGTPGGTCQAPGSAPGTPSTTSSTGFCFAYPPEKQLWSVCVYYYMYDIGHNWPLVVELGFKGQSSEFFRLCCNGDNGAKPANGECKAPSGLKWVRMTEKPGSAPTTIANSSCPDGQGDPCQPCNTGADDTQTSQTDEDRKETCKKDAEFVKRAREIHHAIYSDQSPASVFKAHESDLNDLIERRALEIRTQLNLEYGEKTRTIS